MWFHVISQIRPSVRVQPLGEDSLAVIQIVQLLHSTSLQVRSYILLRCAVKSFTEGKRMIDPVGAMPSKTLK